MPSFRRRSSSSKPIESDMLSCDSQSDEDYVDTADKGCDYEEENDDNSNRDPNGKASLDLSAEESSDLVQNEADEEVTSLADGFEPGPDHTSGATGSRRIKLMSETGDIRELLPYPADPRSVRYPDYDLKNMSRYSKFPDLYFGRKGAAIGHALFRRFAAHRILPTKLLGQTACIQSPWISKDVIDGARIRLLESIKTKVSNKFSFQKGQTIPLITEKAQEYLPGAMGTLTLHLGYMESVQKIKLGLESSLLVSETGLPINNEEEENSNVEGLMFDAGGIVYDAGWAPRARDDDQYLLLSVAPLKDDALVDGNGSNYDRSKGCLQLWKFPLKYRDNIVRLPHRPYLSRVFCADWGRFRRIQWCPIPIDANGILGRVATLCGDGAVRVFEVEMEKELGTTEYSK